jgi:hypothetical protein
MMRALKYRGKSFLAGGLVAVVSAMAFVSPAGATVHHPKGEFANFGECPLSVSSVTDCVYSVSNGGAFKIGNKTVPLKNPVTLQGGFEGAGESVKFYGAETGNTLSKTPQPVPGGLLGITAPTWWPKSIQEWFNNLISEGFTGVNATVELTGPTKGLTKVKLNVENLLTESGTALGLPAKIHLENAILGSNCYIGTESNPVQINFTSGKSGALQGSLGEVSFNEAFTLIKFSGGKLVDGTFSAPGVSGCGGIFSIFINPLVNSILGTPAASGQNQATLQGTIEDGSAFAVKASE